MGTIKNGVGAPRKADTKRRSPFASVKGSQGQGQDVTPVSWAAIDGAILHDCLTEVTNAGDGLTLSLSKDLSVYAVTIHSGGERKQFYTRRVEEIEEWLSDVTALYQT